MMVYYRCPSCSALHPGRVQAPDREWLGIAMDAFGSVLEKCPRTDDWIHVSAPDLLCSSTPATELQPLAGS